MQLVKKLGSRSKDSEFESRLGYLIVGGCVRTKVAENTHFSTEEVFLLSSVDYTTVPTFVNL